MSRAPTLALSLAVLVFPIFSAPQTFGPGEVTAHTEPYAPATGLTIRTQVRLVEVPVIVRDKHRNAVSGLRKENFTLFDSGKQQEISSFSVETFTPEGNPAAPANPVPAAAPLAKAPSAAKSTTAPRYVALVFDDLSTDAASLMHSKAAAAQFVRNELAPGDQVAIVTTAFPRNAAFTADREALAAQIGKVNPGSRGSADSSSSCPSIGPYEGYLIANHLDRDVLLAKVEEYNNCANNPPHPEDTVTFLARGVWEHVMANSRTTLQVIDSVVDRLAKAEGRRMILLTSGGFLSGNLENDEEYLISKALHAGVVINALNPRGAYTIIPGGDASTPAARGRTPRSMITAVRIQSSNENAKDDGMVELSSGTGGVFFHNNNDLLRGFHEVGMVPEVMYVLGFSAPEALPVRFRPLKVKVNPGGGYAIQARMGYTPAKATPPPEAASGKLDSAMASSEIVSDLPARLTWQADQRGGGETMVAHLDLTRLRLDWREGRRSQHITLAAVLRDLEGHLVAGVRSEVELNLTDATFNRLLATGELQIGLTVQAPPGSYTARGLVLDGLEGKTATSNQQVRVQK